MMQPVMVLSGVDMVVLSGVDVVVLSGDGGDIGW